MGNVLDMNEFRARQRAQRRFCKDLVEAAEHKAMHPHKPATPTEAMRAAAQAASTGWNIIDQKSGAHKAELIAFVAQGRHGPKLSLEDYLDEILEKAYNGSHWAQFRLALIQLADEAPGAAREQMQLAFPNMDPNQFEIWLDRATVEFDEYTDMLDNDHQP